jgi:hypothetical protein
MENCKEANKFGCEGILFLMNCFDEMNWRVHKYIKLFIFSVFLHLYLFFPSFGSSLCTQSGFCYFYAFLEIILSIFFILLFFKLRVLIKGAIIGL